MEFFKQVLSNTLVPTFFVPNEDPSEWLTILLLRFFSATGTDHFM